MRQDTRLMPEWYRREVNRLQSIVTLPEKPICPACKQGLLQDENQVHYTCTATSDGKVLYTIHSICKKVLYEKLAQDSN